MTGCPLTGTWRLRSCVFDDGQAIRHPYGSDPAGFLTYTPDGTVIVVLGDPARSELANPDWRENTDADIAAAARPCVAYCGTYEYRGNEVAHHVAFSLMPNWIGRTLVRQVTLTGDTLTLTTPEMSIDGRRQTATLTWQRARRPDRSGACDTRP